MRARSVLLFACLSSILSACWPPTGDYARTVDTTTGKVTDSEALASGLQLSGQQVNAMASRHFGMLAITIENRRAAWRQLTNLRISLRPRELKLEERVIVPSGAALDAWADATIVRNDFMLRDTQTVLRATGIWNWVDRVTVGRRPLDTAELESGRKTLAALREHPDAARAYLPGHLFEGPILVPPGLHTTRWIVLNTPHDLRACIESFELEFDVDTGAHERVLITFSPRSDWQGDYCAKSTASGRS
jgi:hypothetical protein